MTPLPPTTKEAEFSSGCFPLTPPTVRDQDTLGDTWTMEKKSPTVYLRFFSHIKTKSRSLTRSKEQRYIKIDSSSGINPRTSVFISTIRQFISKVQALLMPKPKQRPPQKDQTTTSQRTKQNRSYLKKQMKTTPRKWNPSYSEWRPLLPWQSRNFRPDWARQDLVPHVPKQVCFLVVPDYSQSRPPRSPRHRYQKENNVLPPRRHLEPKHRVHLNLHVMILNPYPNFPLFSTIYLALSVTRSSLVPSRAARTVTKSPDKSPDRPHD